MSSARIGHLGEPAGDGDLVGRDAVARDPGADSIRLWPGVPRPGTAPVAGESGDGNPVPDRSKSPPRSPSSVCRSISKPIPYSPLCLWENWMLPRSDLPSQAPGSNRTSASGSVSPSHRETQSSLSISSGSPARPRRSARVYPFQARILRCRMPPEGFSPYRMRLRPGSLPQPLTAGLNSTVYGSSCYPRVPCRGHFTKRKKSYAKVD